MPTSSTQTIWTLGHWRCEVHPTGRLRLYRGSALISEHQPMTLDFVQDYAEIWRAAIAELPEAAAPTRLRIVQSGLGADSTAAR